MKSCLTILTLCSLITLTSAFAETEVLNPIEIRDESFKLRDRVKASVDKLTLVQPSANLDLTASLSRMPGMTVRNTAGYGSLLTVFPAGSMNAGNSQVSISQLPISNPLGTGVNLSLLPSTFIEKIEIISPLASNFNHELDSRASPGGRISLEPSLEGNSTTQLKGQLNYGLFNTGQGSLLLKNGSENLSYGVGVLGATTDGHYRYKSPETLENTKRDNNAATGVGGLGFFQKKSESADFKVFGFYHQLEKTNPGPLNYPSRDHEKDQFGFLGVKARYHKTDFKISTHHTRTITVTDPSFTPSRSDDRLWDGYFKASHPFSIGSRVKLLTTFDHEQQRLQTGNGKFYRALSGVTMASPIELDEKGVFVVSPLMRSELINQFHYQYDLRNAFLYIPSEKFQAMAGFGYDHVYPDITAFSGYTAAFGKVRPNKNIQMERHRAWNASYALKLEKVEFYQNFFYDHVSNRTAFQFLSDGTSQYVNLSSVRLMGVVSDAYYLPLHWLTLRASLTLQHGKDLRTDLALPYKPKVQTLGSIGVKPIENLLITLEQSYQTKTRYSATTDANRADAFLKPWFTTNLRFDYKITKSWVSYLRGENLFQRAGFEFPQYPRAGRVVTVGVSYGEF